MHKKTAAEKSDQRHKRLKEAERQRYGERIAYGNAAEHHAVCHAYRKRVHRKRDAEQQQFGKAHATEKNREAYKYSVPISIRALPTACIYLILRKRKKTQPKLYKRPETTRYTKLRSACSK